MTDRNRPLRLWPGVVLVVLQWLIRFVVPRIAPETGALGVIGGLSGGLAIVLWWVLFSRAPWKERLGATALMIVAIALLPSILHESFATAGMGVLWLSYVVPVLSLAFVAWAVAGRSLSGGWRWASMAATILLACGAWTLVRIGGFTGGMDTDFAWRWAPTPEERLLARAGDQVPQGQPSAAWTEEAAERLAETRAAWPGFRGPDRDGRISGPRLATDWAKSPPVELWRRQIGPGWSSFAVHGDLIYTQEQRGEEEVVACYDATTGLPIWRHGDRARFWEANAGAGPRGTPTVSGGRVFTFGATGIVNALDALDGAVIWTRNAADDTGADLPTWGFASSPLVVEDVVVVAASGRLVAYEASTGEPRWYGPDGGTGYSSPQLVTLDGFAQVLHLGSHGLYGIAPVDGAVLWEHPWKGYPIVQPAVTGDGGVLISVNADSGTRRLAVKRGSGEEWSVEESWTSRGLKPYFNDFVVHERHAFGFDGSILAAIDVASGERRWKGGRYGNGQLVLLANQNLLLVLSENGELALVAAVSNEFRELTRFRAIEGKTWNHPVVVGNRLLVRNGREMAAFRLPLAAG